MDIKVAKKLAAKCLKLSMNYIELSPTAQKIFGAISGRALPSSHNWLNRWVNNLLRKTLCWRLDQLILLNDPSVRVMTIRAMKNIKHRSQYIGLIATLCTSTETGDVLNQAGEKMNSHEVSIVVRDYLYDFLKITDYDKELFQAKRHWEGVLAIDYTKEFSIEKRLDFSGKKGVYFTRDLTPEEVAVKIAENKAEVMVLYQYDLNNLQQKKRAGFYEQRRCEVYQSLDEIVAYISFTDMSTEIFSDVTDLLCRMAISGNFPREWLPDLMHKYSVQLRELSCLKSS